MAITALGIGTKGAPENTNLDPQSQFWSWLRALRNPDEIGDDYHHERAYFSGFKTVQTDPAGMSVQIGGTSTIDSAVLWVPLRSDKADAILLSTDGNPEVVTIPTAPASGSRIDTIVIYIDRSNADANTETPGTPEYVHTLVVSGAASNSPSAPTDSQIIAALPVGANSRYYPVANVSVSAGQTVITNDNITSLNPASPNVYWTTSDFNEAATNRINALVPNMIVNRAPYVASVSSRRTNNNSFSMTAPAPKSGYKFLAWYIVATQGMAAQWNTDTPTNRTANFFYVSQPAAFLTHTVIGYALYVPTS